MQDSCKISSNDKSKIEEIMIDQDFPFRNLTIFLSLASDSFINEFNSIKSDPRKLKIWLQKQQDIIERLRKNGTIHKDARLSSKTKYPWCD